MAVCYQGMPLRSGRRHSRPGLATLAGRSIRPRSPRALGLNIPNLITLGRILSVPVMVWAISSGEMLFAFALFVLAGLSDAVDGYLAKRLNMASELGAF